MSESFATGYGADEASSAPVPVQPGWRAIWFRGSQCHWPPETDAWRVDPLTAAKLAYAEAEIDLRDALMARHALRRAERRGGTDAGFEECAKRRDAAREHMHALARKERGG